MAAIDGIREASTELAESDPSLYLSFLMHSRFRMRNVDIVADTLAELLHFRDLSSSFVITARTDTGRADIVNRRHSDWTREVDQRALEDSL